MKKFNTDLKYLILIWFLLTLAIIPTFAHHGNILIDCGREAYYPLEILKGKILYKDIFDIYGPFSYMLNAQLFNFFGINLNVLYIAGGICTFLIATFTYLISTKFLTKFSSFAITLLIIVLGVLSPSLANFIFPYSFGIIYGLAALLISLFILICYSKAPQKSFLLPLSGLFAGISFCSKYEFFLYIIVLIIAAIKVKKLNFGQYLAFLGSILAIPAVCFVILFFQGLRVEDLQKTFILIQKMGHCETLKYFYKSVGVYFFDKTPLILLENLAKTAIPFCIFIFGFGRKNKVLSIFLITVATIATCYTITPLSFVFLPILTMIFAVFSFKKLLNNNALLFLTLTTILAGAKVFFGLITLHYGVYFLGLYLITLFALIREFFGDKKTDLNAIGIYLITIALILAYQNILMLKNKTYEIKTEIGNIYTEKKLFESTKELITYIQKHTKKQDKVAIYPEGMLINFLAQRDSDDYYSSLIPLYVETLGEKTIIQHLKTTKPKYIIFNNWNTKDYYYKYICKDYAVTVCNYVAKNYTLTKTIDKNEFRFMVFKRK